MSTQVTTCKKTEAAVESKDVRPCSSYFSLSSSHLPKNRIPKSWFRCPRKARDFVVDRFLAFKLPVDERYDDNISVDQKFSPEMVIQAVEMRSKTLDLWIDLTTEENFYSCSSLEKKGIQVISLPCGSSRGPPTITNVGLFIHYVDTSIKRDPKGIIGVHSVHGFNRVGFLIVAYLIERMGFSVNAALATFTNAHPPGIYKQAYVQELYFRYDFVQMAPKPLPLPPWHFKIGSSHQEYLLHTSESNVSLKRRRNAIDDPLASLNGLDCSEEKQAKRFKRFTAESSAPFADNFPGFTPVSDPTQLSELQMLCQAMARWHRPNFPGSLPNPVNSQSLRHLQLKPYCVTWIADGIRFMMLIIKKNHIYVFDRSFKCFKVEGLTFPSRTNLHCHLRNTLLDGQMVFDKVDGKVIPRFLVFDILLINGESVYSHPFLPVRYDCISREIISPRSEAIRQGVIDRTIEPFSIRQKTFHDLSHCQSLLSPSFTGSIGHGSSGLIFQSITDPYVPGVSSVSLKWKPQSKISMDFRLQVVIEGDIDLGQKVGQLWVEGFMSPVARVSSVSTIEDFHHKIVECVYQDGQWIALRERTDKSSPNTYETYLSVWSSIRNVVETGELLEFVGRLSKK